MEYHRRPSLIGPLILITIGVLFLLANLGMLPLTFWEIAARFWPLVLILIGLEIILGRRSLIGSLIVVVLWLALIAGVVWLSFAGGGILPAAATTSEQLTQPLSGIQSASIDLNIGISRVNINALNPNATDLMQGTFHHAEGSQIVKTYNVAGSEGRLALSEQGTAWTFWSGASSRWDIALNPQVPLTLRVNGGAGNANLDLSALNVTALTIDAGVGSLNITTPKAGATVMSVNGGVGSTRITIPPGVAARIAVNGGLGGTHVDEARFPKFDNAYQSADYASAVNKLTIDVNGGVGKIDIQ